MLRVKTFLLALVALFCILQVSHVNAEENVVVEKRQAKSLTRAALIHNIHSLYRGAHGVPALTWDTDLALRAQNFVSRCNYSYSSDPYGQNIGFNFADWGPCVADWYQQIKNYNFNEPGYNVNTSQFTQMIWKNSKQVGCGLNECNNNQKFILCYYSPAGNTVSAANIDYITNVPTVQKHISKPSWWDNNVGIPFYSAS